MVSLPNSSRGRAKRLGDALAALVGAGLIGACSPAPTPAPDTNLLLITIDTLRADVLQTYGEERPTSPGLLAFSESAVVFEEAHAASSWTLPTLSSLHTSLLSSSHGAWTFQSRLPESATTLAERLLVAGYDTAAVIQHVFLGRRYGLNQGFVHYDDELVDDFEKSHEAITSEEIAQRGAQFLAAKAASDDERPWFLWMHFFDPHAVYHRHEEEAQVFGDASDFELYRGEVAWTDKHLSPLLDSLAEWGFAEDTVVVLTADHGEAFEEHGVGGHGKNLYRETVRVPLMMRVPGVEPRRVSDFVSMVDVKPTLLELLGLPQPKGLAGRSLAPALRGEALGMRPIVSELGRKQNRRAAAVIEDGYKLIWEIDAERQQLFNLRTDRLEQRDLSADEPDRLEALTRRLNDLRREARENALEDDGVAVATSDAELKALQALGYAEDE